jgi:hypothetical protein
MKSILLEVPESLIVEDPLWSVEHEGVLYELGIMGAEWHEEGGVSIGTVVYNGRKMIQATIELDSSDPVLLLQGLFLIYELDWKVLACQEFDGSEVYSPVQPEVYNYLPKRYSWDEFGVQVELTPEPNWIPCRDGAQGLWKDAFPEEPEP